MRRNYPLHTFLPLSDDALRELRDLYKLCDDHGHDMSCSVLNAYIERGDVKSHTVLLQHSVLHLACAHLKPALVEVLLQQGADPNDERPYFEPAVPDGTYLEPACPLSLAIDAANSLEDTPEAQEPVRHIVTALLAAGACADLRYRSPIGNAGALFVRPLSTVSESLSVRSSGLAAWLRERGFSLPDSHVMKR